jgi:hypothetical protein
MGTVYLFLIYYTGSGVYLAPSDLIISVKERYPEAGDSAMIGSG